MKHGGNSHTSMSIFRRRLNRHGFMHTLVCIAMVTGIGCTVLRCFSPYLPGIVIGRSMTPTLKPYQLFLIDRVSYRRRRPQKDDILVSRHKGDLFIKRVVALPGDELWILTEKESNGEYGVYKIIPAEDLAGCHTLVRYCPEMRLECVRIPEGSVFVEGDNDEASIDSRQMGPVGTDQIVGRICLPRIAPMLKASYLCIRSAGDNWGCMQAVRSVRDKSKLLMSLSLQEAATGRIWATRSIRLDGTSVLASENELAIRVKPGRYIMDMALIDRGSTSSLWSMHRKITIDPGKNMEVKID